MHRSIYEFVRSALAAAFFVLATAPSGLHAQDPAPASEHPTAAAPRESELDAAELRERFLARARLYAEFEWTASERNVLHGEDPNGARIDTPDDGFDPAGWHADGRVNRGMPYAWGGFTSIDEFRAGLERGLAAGLVPRSERAGSSSHALGLDCSGFVARAWELPLKQSTRSLGALCYELDSYDQLEPGDVLNCFDSHVVLFAGWADPEGTRARVFEAARLRVQESEYSVETLRRNGFVAMRYKPLDARWVPMRLDGPSVHCEGVGRFVAEEGSETTALPSLESTLRGARAGDWVRHALVEESGRLGEGARRTSLVARASDAEVSIQSVAEMLGGALYTGSNCKPGASLADSLLEFVAYEEPLGAMEVRESSVESGTHWIGERGFRALRVRASLDGSFVMRHKSFPVTVDAVCVLSDAVPLHGVIEAEFDQSIVWGEDESGAPIVGRRTLRFRLEEFHAG